MDYQAVHFGRVLVATDFSPSSDAALKQALWLADRSGAKVVLAHVLEHLRRAAHSLTYQAKIDLLSAEGDLFQKEIRRASDARMRAQIEAVGRSASEVGYETLLGEPFVELTHAVQQEKYDLLIAGTRGHSGWKQFLVGSTAKKLIRKCPSSVWVVKSTDVGAPRVILAPCDFSAVSRKAVLHGLWLAERADAELHLVHVIDQNDVRDDLVESLPPGSSMREEINEEAMRRLDTFLKSLPGSTERVVSHLTWGYPWQEITRIAEKHQAELITMGTVGRSGIKGVLLGNTAERILDSCHCSILTVKPDDYVSPIEPATWSLHP